MYCSGLTVPTTKAVGFRGSGCLGPHGEFDLTIVLASALTLLAWCLSTFMNWDRFASEIVRLTRPSDACVGWYWAWLACFSPQVLCSDHVITAYELSCLLANKVEALCYHIGMHALEASFGL